MGFSPSRRIMPCVGFCLNSFIYGESHTKQNVPYLWVSCLYSHLGLQVGNWDWWPGDWATWLWMCLSLRGTVCYLLVGVCPQACAFWDRSPLPPPREAREAWGEGAGMEVTHSEGRAWMKSVKPTRLRQSEKLPAPHATVRDGVVGAPEPPADSGWNVMF